MDKKSYRVRNWKDYNEALVQRGSLTFWFSKDCIEEWKKIKRSSVRGRPEKYNDKVIECGLTLKALFKLTFRATEGFMQSMIDMMGLNLDTPNYSLLCKRQKNLLIKLFNKRNESDKGLHIVVDTTGLKVYGEGEWKVRQHGWMKHRLWRKLHIAVNEKTQAIEAMDLTELGVQDCEGLTSLVNQIQGKIDSCIGDGAYDRFSCYERGEERDFQMIAPPQRNARTSYERRGNKKKVSESAFKKRDVAVESVRRLGRKVWKIQSNYHRRSLAETAMFRIKTLLGNRLKAKKFENQKVETVIWCNILNKMTTLGMPNSVTI